VSRQAVHEKIGGAKRVTSDERMKLSEKKVVSAPTPHNRLDLAAPRDEVRRVHRDDHQRGHREVMGSRSGARARPCEAALRKREAHAPTKIRNARRAQAAGAQQAALARRFGVSPKAMSKVLRRETWRDVE
jgi:hypothetical protein